MKRFLSAALIAAAATTALPALAQNRDAAGGGAVGGAAAGAVGGAIVGGPVGAIVGGIAGGAAGATIGSVTPEDRVYVRRYVDEHEVPQVVVRERVEIGRPLPRSVKTYRFEGNQRLQSHTYARVNNQYLLIDEDGNEVGAIEP